MRTLLRVLSLFFAVGVVGTLTMNAAVGTAGCGTRGTVQPQAAPQAAQSPQAVTPPPATPPPANAVPPAEPPPERFIGTSKAGPVFVPRDVRPTPQVPAQTPQQQAR